MLVVLKRYAVAFGFLFLVIILMLLGTMGVTMLGDKMIADTGGNVMKPRGEKLIK